MKFAIKTLGCKTNQCEAEYLREALLQLGYKESEVPQVFIINTCTVTAEADKKSRKAIHKARHLHPSSYIVVTGCYAQREGERLLKEGADLVVSNDAKHLIPKFILERRKGHVRLLSNIREASTLSSPPMQGAQKRTRAFLLIQDGCDRFCTYCTVPYVRGRARSRREEEVLEQLKRFLDAGHKEVVLVGINIGSYGKEWGGSLAALLHKISKIEGDFRVRLSSIEPDQIDEELLGILSASSRFCNHLHIPLQSGDDRILHLMGRNYTAEEYTLLCQKIKEKIADIGLTTDVMVGFPTEGEKEFEHTLSLIKEIGFLKVHVFAYSKREGTLAARWMEPSHSLKKERSKKVQEVAKKVSFEFRRKFLGKVLWAVMEKECALTSNYMRVKVKGEGDGLLRVRIEKVEEDANYGSILT